MPPARLGARMVSLLPFLVGVGIVVAHNPLHGSGRAGFPHPALASGTDAEAAQRIGVRDTQPGQPAVNEPLHSVPQNSAILTAARERAVPKPAHLEPKLA